jgi:hypothetical protein
MVLLALDTRLIDLLGGPKGVKEDGRVQGLCLDIHQ